MGDVCSRVKKESQIRRIWNAQQVIRESVQLKLHLLHFILISGTGYMRNFTANIVKRIIGMDIYLSPNDIFFRDYVQHLVGLRPGAKITSRGAGVNEGVGSQARLTMCAINFARVLGLTYVHTPFSELSHADRSTESWDKAWEAELNLGAGEIPAEPGDHQIVDFGQIFHRYRYLDTVFNITSKEFQRKYFMNKDPRINPLLTVGIHVRRGDVSKGHRMWTDLTNISTTIKQLKNILDKKTINYRIQVFSEGSYSEFRDFDSLGVQLFLNCDPLWTMRELIEADILVMAKSLFSYIAALISDGIILYEPWPEGMGIRSHPPLKNWLVRRPEGNFDERLFVIQLEAMMVQFNFGSLQASHRSATWPC
jgi:hypothetical protein